MAPHWWLNQAKSLSHIQMFGPDQPHPVESCFLHQTDWPWIPSDPHFANHTGVSRTLRSQRTQKNHNPECHQDPESQSRISWFTITSPFNSCPTQSLSGTSMQCPIAPAREAESESEWCKVMPQFQKQQLCEHNSNNLAFMVHKYSLYIYIYK